MKIKIKVNDEHNRKGTIEVDEQTASELLKRPEYNIYSERKEGKLIFSSKLTEKQIKKLIEENNINIKYNISNNSKKEVLEKLSELGYVVEE